jgi:hypothetical protein
VEILVETGIFYSGSNNNNNNLFIIDEILYPLLQKESFTTADPSPDNTTLGVIEIASEIQVFLIARGYY